MASPSINIRAAKGLDAELAARGDSINEVALRELRRLFAMYDMTLQEEVHLSEGEWSFLRDLLNGTFRDENCARYLWAEVQDADEVMDEKWGVRRDVLSSQLREMSAFQRLAIVDAVDRWWRAQRQEAVPGDDESNVPGSQ